MWEFNSLFKILFDTALELVLDLLQPDCHSFLFENMRPADFIRYPEVSGKSVTPLACVVLSARKFAVRWYFIAVRVIIVVMRHPDFGVREWEA